MGKEIKKCLIITGAPEDDIDYYKHYIDGRFIIGADSGYQKCVKLNIKPNLIIGDFDSSTKPDTDIETIILPVRKDDTDTLSAVKEAGAEKILPDRSGRSVPYLCGGHLPYGSRNPV